MSTEPPDIKNWFAIYAYESPVLDTNDELRLSNYQESKITRAGLHIGIKRREWHKNYSTQNNDASVGKKMVSAGLVRTNSSVEHNRQDHKYWGKAPMDENDDGDGGMDDDSDEEDEGDVDGEDDDGMDGEDDDGMDGEDMDDYEGTESDDDRGMSSPVISKGGPKIKG